MSDHGSTWVVESFADAERIINVLHRRSIRDASELSLLRARLRVVEEPWWHPIKRRRHRKYLAFVERAAAKGPKS